MKGREQERWEASVAGEGEGRTGAGAGGSDTINFIYLQVPPPEVPDLGRARRLPSRENQTLPAS